MQNQTNHSPTIPSLLCALSALLLIPIANAQQPESTPNPSPAERLEKMAERLQLNSEQRSKIKTILEKSGPEIREMMSKGRQNASEADRTKIRELLKAQSEEVAAILTPEQREKFRQTRNATLSSEDRLQRMTTALSLTTEQQAKVKAIMDTRGTKLRELMAKGRDNASEADKEQFKELMKQQFEEISAVLTPEQKSKFKEIRDQRGPAKPAEKASN